MNMEDPNTLLTEEQLRDLIQHEFLQAGWTLSDNRFVPPTSNGKDDIRKFHTPQRIERAQGELNLVHKYGIRLLQEFAAGDEINPAGFQPLLTLVDSSSWENNLFRFATLLWSVPVSSGYGRRMRYILRDASNGKLVGIFALMDPIFNLKVRDQNIGWNVRQREDRLYNVMDAYVLGAVPPYNMLLGGKMVSLATISEEVRHDFEIKYEGRETGIRKEKKQASLVLITTTSALGRSSIYNRIKLPGEKASIFQSIGFSRGWGHFQISDSTFKALRNWMRSMQDPYADGHQYGDGPNWRLRTIRRGLSLLGFDDDSMHHGIQREVFIAPLAKNYQQFLCGKTNQPEYYQRKLDDMGAYFRERWLLPRSRRQFEWRGWTRDHTWELILKNYYEPTNEKQLHLL